jgi:hypothetical protein
MMSAEPRHSGFLELAVQHRYPLRHLNTYSLPSCRLDAYLAQVQGDGLRLNAMHKHQRQHPNEPFLAILHAEQTHHLHKCMLIQCSLQIDSCANCQQAPESLTSLVVYPSTLKEWATRDEGAPACVLSMADMLRGINSLRSLSCLTSSVHVMVCTSHPAVG